MIEEEAIETLKHKRQKRFLQKSRNRDRWSRIIKNVVDGEVTPRMVGTASNHGKLCSCHMCGNPRKFNNELTMQEKKFYDKVNSFRDDL